MHNSKRIRGINGQRQRKGKREIERASNLKATDMNVTNRNPFSLCAISNVIRCPCKFDQTHHYISFSMETAIGSWLIRTSEYEKEHILFPFQKAYECKINDHRMSLNFKTINPSMHAHHT